MLVGVFVQEEEGRREGNVSGVQTGAITIFVVEAEDGIRCGVGTGIQKGALPVFVVLLNYGFFFFFLFVLSFCLEIGRVSCMERL